MTDFKKRKPNGFANLPVVIAVMILIVAIAIGITAVSLSEIFISASQNQSSQAFVYAEVGAKDALLKLTRDYKYACPSADCYSIDFAPPSGCSQNEGCARIQVTNTASPATIISKGQVKNKTRRIQVNVTYNSEGQITDANWQELSD